MLMIIGATPRRDIVSMLKYPEEVVTDALRILLARGSVIQTAGGYRCVR